MSTVAKSPSKPLQYARFICLAGLLVILSALPVRFAFKNEAIMTLVLALAGLALVTVGLIVIAVEVVAGARPIASGQKKTDSAGEPGGLAWAILETVVYIFLPW